MKYFGTSARSERTYTSHFAFTSINNLLDIDHVLPDVSDWQREVKQGQALSQAKKAEQVVEQGKEEASYFTE
eukprot:scaffold2161_cov212-Alexandrium_tamarense.AAC.24